jgi:ribosome biogenesis GTPase A
MAIQWYPGHMTKARRELAELIPSQDVIIEVLDARMPGASENPVVTELRRHKPCIKVLSKSDLADPVVTAAWIAHFEIERSARSYQISGRVVATPSTTTRPTEMRTKIPEMCARLGLRSPTSMKAVRALIVGIPNVGKSTLINTLMERSVATVGDKPAVTKAQQQVVLKSGMVLWDSPGILWPKMEDEHASYRLALGGAIPDTVIDYENVALFGARYLLEFYPKPVMARFKITETPESGEALLREIGRRRGCLQRGGIIDMHKASEIFVHECRSGKLGRFTLERPPVFRDETTTSDTTTNKTTSSNEPDEAADPSETADPGEAAAPSEIDEMLMDEQ